MFSDRGRIVRWVLALAPAWVMYNLAGDSWIDPLARGLVALVLAVSIIEPVEGLVVLALLAPFGDLMAIAFDAGPMRLTEALGVAFLLGWLVSPRTGRVRGPRAGRLLGGAAMVLAAIVVTSLAAHTIAYWRNAPEAARHAAKTLNDHYFAMVPDPFGVVAAGRWLEGLALAAAVVALIRRSPMIAVWLPEALGVGCAAATLASTLLWFGIGLPDVLERHALIAPRVVAHVADVNAAGSYFVLVAAIAVGMAGRELGRRRVGWIVGGLAAAFGLWLSRSRSAEIGLLLAVAPAAWWLVTERWPRRIRWGGVGVLAGGIAAAVVLSSRYISDQSTTYRELFTEAAYRVLHAYPWFGVGVGQFYDMSPFFMSPRLAWAYGAENAHNFWLQTAGEIGLLGVGTCVVALARVAWKTGRAVETTSRERYRVLGLASGVAAFLLTCLTGHPLLVFEAAFPFWLAVGLLVALIGQDEQPQPGRQGAALAAVCVLLLLVSVPVRGRQPLPGVRSAREVDGLYGWEDGRRYRWAEQYSSLFVDADVRRLEIPMRLPEEVSREPNEVKIALGAELMTSVTVGSRWTNAVIALPAAFPGDRYWRINLRAERTATIADPATGTREVGVELGPIRIVERADAKP